MSVFIYQIGDLVLKAVASNVNSLRVETDRTWRGETVISGTGNTMGFTNTRQLPDPQEIQVEGTLVCFECETVSDQLNHLMSLGGAPHIDIFGYLPNPCCGMGECSQCGDCVGSNPVQWVWTTGMIKEITRGAEVGSQILHPTSAVSVQIRLVLQPFWYPVNKFTHSVIYNTLEADSFTTIATLTYDPKPLPKYPNTKFVFQKKLYENWWTVYNPTFWTSEYFDPNDYKTITEKEENHIDYLISPNRARWNAPPLSVYAFTNFAGDAISESIFIEVVSEIGAGNIVSYQSADIYLGDLHDQLFARGTELMVDDILIATSQLHSPGFIIRNGAPIVSFVADVDVPFLVDWKYTYEYPGELIGRQNRVHISTPSEVHTYALHTYRMF